jgi:DNA mismatch endonuclease (patch repair protein)
MRCQSAPGTPWLVARAVRREANLSETVHGAGNSFSIHPLLRILNFMRDRLSQERRRWNMSRIRGKNTTPEKRIRSLLHGLGYRFRLHGKKLPGKPDIVLAKYQTVIFVHGCFWHRHRGCRNCTTPTNNRAFWVKKLEGNSARDKLHQRALRKLGRRSLVVWECKTERPQDLVRLSKRLAKLLR